MNLELHCLVEDAAFFAKRITSETGLPLIVEIFNERKNNEDGGIAMNLRKPETFYDGEVHMVPHEDDKHITHMTLVWETSGKEKARQVQKALRAIGIAIEMDEGDYDDHSEEPLPVDSSVA